MTRLVAALVLVLATLSPLLGGGQRSERPAVTARLGAAVKVISTTGNRGGVVGSGAIVDPRGYVLTAFSVVGRVDPATGFPGTLLDPDNRYLVLVPDATGAARSRWVGRVVRADVRLDAALLRIQSDLGGRPARGVVFPTMPLGASVGAGVETPLFVLGYRRASRRPQAAHRTVRRRVRNLLDQISHLGLSGSIDGGFAGGAAVDERGRVIGITRGARTDGRVDAVRPVERIPVLWIDELARGEEVADTRIDGVRRLEVGRVEQDLVAGPEPNQALYYRLPRERPLELRVDPALPLELWHGGRRVRRGRGRLPIGADVPDAVVAVRVPASHRSPVAFGLSAHRASPIPAVRPEPRREPDPMLMIPGIGPSFSGGRRGEATGARVVGTVVDAVTGRPVSGARVIVSPRALDLGAHVSRYLLGELSETAFREPLLGRARTNFRGELTLTGIPPGGPYRLAAFAARYRPAVITFRAGRDGPVDVGTVRLTR